MPARSIVVRGRVQGVGYRFFVHETAFHARIAGEVWNRLDGAVEMIVEHPDAEVLASFVDKLHSGPGRVESVQVTDTVEHGFKDFRVGATR